MDKEALRGLGAKPISPDSPAGDEVRDCDEFGALQVELDKLTSPTASGGIDWKRVEALGAAILDTKGKDLTVACYLAIALLRNRGGEGLVLGMGILADLLQGYWDTLYPSVKRLRGRNNALIWWRDRMQEELEQQEFPAFSPDAIKSIKDSFAAIDDVLQEKDSDPPGIMQLKGLLDRLDVEEEAPQPAAAPSADEAAAKSPDTPVAAPEAGQPRPSAAPAPAAIPPASPVLPQDAGHLMDQGLSQLALAAGALLQAGLQNPLPYRLNRLAAWGGLEGLPPAQNGRTRIPPPAQAIGILTSLKAGNDAEGLVRFAESRLAEVPLWLDLNRIAAQALGQLGFAQARKGVEVAVSGLLERVPDLAGMAFADGTPLADGETRAWLDGLAPKGGGGAETNDGVEAIRGLVSQGDLAGAAGALKAYLDATPSIRNRLRARVAFVELLLAQNKAPWAWISTILQDVDTFRLDEYDPETAASALAVVWRAIQAGVHNDDALEESLLARLSRIDCALALKLAG